LKRANLRPLMPSLSVKEMRQVYKVVLRKLKEEDGP
jgi:hypothetical protein